MIIDTSVLSPLFSKDPKKQAQVANFLQQQPRILTSAIVIMEIEFGLQKLGSKKVLADFHEFLEDETLLDIIAVDTQITLLAAKKRAEMQKKGIILHTEDLLIGATAKMLGVPIATQNRQDFEPWNIEIISPFS
ncbi:MAG TPA: type II toxin-antitoxin system VapC family toxin [Oligoflexus sp.]|uniref:type II toxin-antitoxin system VapC family toxin n=1 Tax=Oligoflexus sp. TaxID=1971216 RepID=UPI002D59F148|nr:type II toxin-antitoxin system VapC family toxin [Oligoflexus sp.]HYX36131.1 type II toxin-antitoxin system VapC family toxin [Oligoflexus sp.]